MGDFDVDCEGSGPRARARVRVMGSVRVIGRIRSWLHLGSRSDVGAAVRLSCSVTVRHG